VELLPRFFHSLWLPTAHYDDWDSEIVNLVQALLAVASAAVSGIAGEYISQRRSSNKPLQPIARETRTAEQQRQA
jgi:hypothetical protein